MGLALINNPKYHGEVNCFRGLSDLQETLERLMKDAQGWVMEVMKELVNVEVQLNLCKKRLEISDVYEELDRQYRLVNPVPIRPCHALVQSPLMLWTPISSSFYCTTGTYPSCDTYLPM